MASNDVQIMQQFVDAIVPELKEVSGRFADSIESEVNSKGFQITASPYINVLIDGRAPTRVGAPKGSPTLQQIIRRWIDEKGITPRPSKGVIPTKDQLSWAISQSIHRDGTLLYQRGGGNDIFEGIITPSRIENLINLLTPYYINEVTGLIFNE